MPKRIRYCATRKICNECGMKIKTCKKHGTEYTVHCKTCQKDFRAVYVKNNAEKIKASKRAYYEKKVIADRIARRITAQALPSLTANDLAPVTVAKEKPCVKCKKIKLIEKFIARHDTKDGHAGVCSACRSKANRNREAAKTQAAQPVWLTVHKMDDSPHRPINRVSRRACGMSSLEY